MYNLWIYLCPKTEVRLLVEYKFSGNSFFPDLRLHLISYAIRDSVTL